MSGGIPAKAWIKIDNLGPDTIFFKVWRFRWEEALRFEHDKFFKLEWYGKSPHSGDRMIVIKIGSYTRRLIFSGQ